MRSVSEAHAGAHTELEGAGGEGQQPGDVLHLLARHDLAQLAQARGPGHRRAANQAAGAQAVLHQPHAQLGVTHGLQELVGHLDVEDDGLLSHLDTEVSLVPGAPLRCVSATNTNLDRSQIRDNGDVVFKIRLVTIFTLGELDFLLDSLMSDSFP